MITESQPLKFQLLANTGLFRNSWISSAFSVCMWLMYLRHLFLKNWCYFKVVFLNGFQMSFIITLFISKILNLYFIFSVEHFLLVCSIWEYNSEIPLSHVKTWLKDNENECTFLHIQRAVLWCVQTTIILPSYIDCLKCHFPS